MSQIRSGRWTEVRLETAWRADIDKMSIKWNECHGRHILFTLVVDLKGFALRRGDLGSGLGMMLCLVMRSRGRVRFGGGKRLLDGHCMR